MTLSEGNFANARNRAEKVVEAAGTEFKNAAIDREDRDWFGPVVQWRNRLRASR